MAIGNGVIHGLWFAGERGVSRVDVGQLLGPTGLHVSGRRLGIGQGTAGIQSQSPKRPNRPVSKIVESAHGGAPIHVSSFRMSLNRHAKRSI